MDLKGPNRRYLWCCGEGIRTPEDFRRNRFIYHEVHLSYLAAHAPIFFGTPQMSWESRIRTHEDSLKEPLHLPWSPFVLSRGSRLDFLWYLPNNSLFYFLIIPFVFYNANIQNFILSQQYIMLNDVKEKWAHSHEHTHPRTNPKWKIININLSEILARYMKPCSLL